MTYLLHPIVSVRSRAKIFRVIPTKNFIRGRKFEIKVKFLNKGERYAGGEFDLEIRYSTRQANRLRGSLPPMASDESFETQTWIFDALADGYGLIHCTIKSDKEVTLIDDSDRALAAEDAVSSIYVLAERDVYTFYALIVSVTSLAMIVLERLIRLLLDRLCDP